MVNWISAFGIPHGADDAKEHGWIVLEPKVQVEQVLDK
jgi:hypothetical protein